MRLLGAGVRDARKRMMPYHGRMAELVLRLSRSPMAVIAAECLTENVFTQGDT